MKTLSLRSRFLTLHLLLVTLALLITGYGLTQLFERHVERRVSAELDTFLVQITAKISFDENNDVQLPEKFADPRFEKIFSGLYWQVNNETSGTIRRSRSLWDHLLILPERAPATRKVRTYHLEGPAATILLAHERHLVFNNAGTDQILRIVVALDIADLNQAIDEFTLELAIALFILAVFLFLAGWVQISIGLRPLKFVRDSIAAVREGTSARVTAQLPSEVSPLADEVNNLLGAQEQAIAKAKNRADNLAHGFKTPLTALISDVKRLRERGQEDIAADIEEVTRIFRRQIERELTSSRIRAQKTQSNVNILDVIDNITTTLKRTPDGENKAVHINCAADTTGAIDVDDLAEILGNLLENAFKHAKSAIAINVTETGSHIKITIEDDGPGISPQLLELAQQRGVRLDQSVSGTGLGLAIVNEILEIYGTKLKLENAQMGGLKVSFKLNPPFGPAI